MGSSNPAAKPRAPRRTVTVRVVPPPAITTVFLHGASPDWNASEVDGSMLVEAEALGIGFVGEPRDIRGMALLLIAATDSVDGSR